MSILGYLSIVNITLFSIEGGNEYLVFENFVPIDRDRSP